MLNSTETPAAPTSTGSTVRPWRRRWTAGGTFSEDDYIAFLDQAHQRLRAPMVLIWDNLNTHVSHRMHALTAARPWLTRDPVTRLRSGHQPHRRRLALNERGLTNIAACGIDHLAELVKRRLRACQQQNELLAGFFTSTGMILELEPPR